MWSTILFCLDDFQGEVRGLSTPQTKCDEMELKTVMGGMRRKKSFTAVPSFLRFSL
jgi:hypothetical protein